MTQLEQNFFEAATKYCREHSTDCNYNNEIDWEQRRYEIAKDAMCALIISDSLPHVTPALKVEGVAVAYADALIKELKKYDK